MRAMKAGVAFGALATAAVVAFTQFAGVVETTPAGTRGVAGVAGAAAPTRPVDRYRAGDLAFYEAFAYPEGAQVEVYTALDDMLTQATAVVLAQVTDVRITRVVGPTPAEALPYVGVTIRPVEVLSGALPARHSAALTVEFVSVAGAVDELRAMAPGGYAVWVLRNKAELPAGFAKGTPPVAERDYYRLVSSQGLFVQGETHVVNPLAHEDGPEIPIEGDPGHGAARRDPVLVSAEQHATLSSLVDHARTF